MTSHQAVEAGDLGALGIEQAHREIDPVLLDPHPQELPRLEVDRVDVDLSTLELTLQDEAVGEAGTRGGRRLRGSAEQPYEQQESERDAAESGREPARNGRETHPLFSLGG